ncbi:iron chaperone [Nocardia fluminea]|uniref:iron chaperone n=1 Tax=Nocardia fluminea TaxID=134984 RepID=UPI00380B4A6B
MVQSKATDVAAYLAEFPQGRREALTELRDLCLQELPGFTEVMAYGMPVYERDGTGEVAFADRLASHDMGKGCLRFRKEPDYELVRDLLRATASGDGAVIC